MVVLLDLDEDVPDPRADPGGEPAGFVSFESFRRLAFRAPVTVEDQKATEVDRPNPNLNIVSAALGCYPIITQITSNIDLNTLHALSRTCRQIRANILQYRESLAQSTLRCENEVNTNEVSNVPPSRSRDPRAPKWHILGEAGHLVSGKVSTCARDFVSDCCRCGRIQCRNCAIKPPSSTRLPSRHRRLCSKCLSAPLAVLTASRDPCTCRSAFHLCAPCGAKLATGDTTYKRVWTWRTRYTTYLGGLGTGIGEGNEGVKCARGASCLGAKDVEVEFECPSSSGSDSSSGDGIGEGGAGTPLGEKEEAGYWRQEVEGLGGVVKKKFRKRERVGRTVREWEDEREGGEILGREKDGSERSWCGWCGRVVLGERDLET